MNTENLKNNTTELIKTETAPILQDVDVEKIKHASEGNIAATSNEVAQKGETILGSVGNYSGATEAHKAEAKNIVDGTNKEVEDLRQQIDAQIQAVGQDSNASNESKEAFPENHILNPNMLNRIAQLEAISPETGEFSQERYDDYYNNQAKLVQYSVVANQQKIQEGINQGKELRRIRGVEVIYGQGGWNRYGIDMNDGTVSLLRGVSVTSGSEKYQAALAAKAAELGLRVG